MSTNAELKPRSNSKEGSGKRKRLLLPSHLALYSIAM